MKVQINYLLEYKMSYLSKYKYKIYKYKYAEANSIITPQKWIWHWVWHWKGEVFYYVKVETQDRYRFYIENLCSIDCQYEVVW